MAERRMFSKTIIDSDAFLDMSLSTQALYFHLSMRADDEGFINNPKKIMRMIGASEDDLKVLIMKNFILTFESGVIVIKHWKIHNCIRKDRLVITNYQEERNQLELKDNDSYTFKNSAGIPLVNQVTTSWQPNVNQMSAQYSIGKDSIGKVSKGKDSIDILASSSESDSKLFIELPLIDKTGYPIYEKDIETWKTIYPAVNIEQEIRNMFGWLDSNPKNRKTKSGIRRFINSWLSRSQNTARVDTNTTTTTQVIDRDPNDMSQMTDEEIVAYLKEMGI